MYQTKEKEHQQQKFLIMLNNAQRIWDCDENNNDNKWTQQQLIWTILAPWLVDFSLNVLWKGCPNPFGVPPLHTLLES